VSANGLIVTSLVHLRGDLWSVGDVRWQDASPRWLSWFRFR
jgi:hypothetical protein